MTLRLALALLIFIPSLAAQSLPLVSELQLFSDEGFNFEPCGVGDVDADGVRDIAVCYRSVAPNGQTIGVIDAFSGATSSRLHQVLRVPLAEAFILGVHDGGDLTGDGHDEILVYRRDPGSPGLGPDSPPQVQSFDGQTSASLWIVDVGVELSTTEMPLAPVPLDDVDGDGLDDVLVAVRGARTASSPRRRPGPAGFGESTARFSTRSSIRRT